MVFQLQTEEYPASWRSHDRLGAVYVGLADTARAIASYLRSLELNPTNQATVGILTRLGAKP
jgi:cytochrome c-type biogenesis protein CcmH/NrfG